MQQSFIPKVTLPLDALLAQRQSTSPISDATSGNGPWPGPHRGRKHGQGLDFEELRQYVPGDDTRHIDWKVTARRNATYTRLYREEKERLLTVALDFRSPMFTGSETLSAVTAGLLAAKIAWQAADLSNRCNLVIQTDHKLHTIAPATGTNSALSACKLIADTFNYAIKNRNPSNLTDMEPLLKQLLGRGRFTGSVVVISAGDELGGGFDQLMPVLSSSAAVAWVLIEDPMEWQTMPNGRYGYRHALSGDLSGDSSRDNSKQHSNEFVRINADFAAQLKSLLEEAKKTLIDRVQNAGASTVSIRHGTTDVMRALYQWQILA